MNVVPGVLINPVSHNPLGTPLSSPWTPFVPLVVECGVVLIHCQITESPVETRTLVGEKRRPPEPTITVVVAPIAGCKEMKNAAIAATVSVLMPIFIVMVRDADNVICSRQINCIQTGGVASSEFQKQFDRTNPFS